MRSGSIRRAQLISPFGVGAMSVLLDGTSVITAGLDHWYDTDDSSNLAIEEYEESDWRLQARLGVASLRLPPDWRTKPPDGDPRNSGLLVPALRFPLWHFCIYCKRLERSTLTMLETVRCRDQEHAGRRTRPVMAQVPFVTICRAGHLDDFPFREWVHRTADPTCEGVLRLRSVGGGGLEGQVVTCGPRAGHKDDPHDGCGATRPLTGITGSTTSDRTECTTLTDTLSSDREPFLCTGARPWLHEMRGECGLPTRGALRAAGNVYFPKVESSIYLPQHEGAVSSQMHDLLRLPQVAVVLKVLQGIPGLDITGEAIRTHLTRSVPEKLIAPISDEELLSGYLDHFGPQRESQDEPQHPAADEASDSLTSAAVWRYPEFTRIRECPTDDYLSATDPTVHDSLAGLYDRVRSVDVLRETRALRGFTRVYDSDLPLSEGKALLQRTTPARGKGWLPAYVVKGEGIYLELHSQRLVSWEQRPEVLARAHLIQGHYAEAAARRGQVERIIEPRFILLHTLAHILINQLIFDCGYSSAALRERLYASTTEGQEMAGLLIYTAAGDSEGTMGGLVRMARPDNLQSVLTAATDSARWCSTDPVCMDSGEKGQGPESCNLAACHGCALLPETSCEEFNRFLDRGLVIGTFDDPSLGYFS